MVDLRHGDSVKILAGMADNSVDSIVTDPPYGLGFMGKKWDSLPPGQELFGECLRVLKPGGHLLAFGGSRTYHRLAVAVEDAGFEIRDQIMWVYGSGFPKSMDVSKAIDKAAGAEREVVGEKKTRIPGGTTFAQDEWTQAAREMQSVNITAPALPAAKQWEGWGTALKPAHEPIVVARKPLVGTVAKNVLEHGTGAINVDECRIAGEDSTARHNSSSSSYMTGRIGEVQPKQEQYVTGSNKGRWPANFIHDGSDEVLELFPETKSGKMGPWNNRTTDGSPNGIYGKFDESHPLSETIGDSGSAARFFYCAKASKKDREEGLENFEPKRESDRRKDDGAGGDNPRNQTSNSRRNHHPTVKPTDLMRYLVRLVTPPGGTVLDPFTGSGSTGKAAILEGFSFIGIEKEEEYLRLAEARIAHAKGKE